MPGLVPLSVTANGAVVTLFFEEELTSGPLPAGLFQVDVDNVDAPIAGVFVIEDRVEVTLATPFTAGQTVAISYTDPTEFMDDLEDVIQSSMDGMDAVSFVDLAATNITPPPPTVDVTADDTSLKAGQTATITFSFSDAPTGFDASDVTATGGAITNFAATGDPKVYTATFTPSGSGDAKVEVNAGSYTNASAVAGGGDSVDLTVDQTAPTVTVTADQTALKAGQTATITFSFSEAPVDFTSGDPMVANGTLSAFTATLDPKVYTAVFTPDGEGPAAVGVPMNTYTDAAGNNGGQDIAYLTVDFTAPTVTVTADDTTLVAGQTAAITFTFSEAPTGFDATDLQVTNGVVSNLVVTGDPKVYTATFTPSASGPASVEVTAAGYADAAGNDGVVGSVSLTADLSAPGVSVTVDDTSLTPGQTATVTFTFTEAPTGFDQTDVVVTNGSISAITATGDAKVFTATFTPDGEGAAMVKVSGGSYQDADGNPGTAGSVGLTVATPAPPEPPAPPPPPAPTGPTESSDVLTVSPSEPVLSAGAGEDYVTGSVTSDFINGNAGRDTIYGGDGLDSIMGGRDDDLLQGNAGVDILFGDIGDDVVHGGRDGDCVYGNVGNDNVQGDAGADTVRGGRGDDVVVGGADNDLLFGDLGNDVLAGGQGADQFWFPDGAAGLDVIADFSHADGDVIVVSKAFAADFTTLMANVTATEQGDAAIFLDGQTIVLVGVAPATLTASDFLFA